MINKYDSKCFRCGGIVPAGSGETNKVMNQWKTEHKVCPEYIPRTYYNDPFYDPLDPYDNPYHGMSESEWDSGIGDR